MSPHASCPLLQHRRNSEIFKKEALANVCNAVFDFLEAHADCAFLVTVCLEIVSKLWDYCCEDPENDAVVLPPSVVWNKFQSAAMGSALVRTYANAVQHADAKAYLSLDILSLWVSVGAPLDAAVEGVQLIIQQELGLANEFACLKLLRLLARLALHPLPEALCSCVFKFTMSRFASVRSLAKVNDLMLFWTRVSTDVSLCISVMEQYISFVLTLEDELSQPEVFLADLTVMHVLTQRHLSVLAPSLTTIFERVVEQSVVDTGSVKKVALLVYLFTAICMPDFESKRSRPAYDYGLNAQLIFRVFQLMNLTQVYPQLQDEQVLLATLDFAKGFITAYMGYAVPAEASVLFITLSQLLGLDSPNKIIGTLIVLVFKHLDVQNTAVYRCSLEVFSELVERSRASSRTIVRCGLLEFEHSYIIELITKFTQEEVPFLKPGLTEKSRSHFYAGITKLFFFVGQQYNVSFATFAAPLHKTLTLLSAQPSSVLVESLCYDLRGMLSAIINADDFSQFFTWFKANVADVLQASLTEAFTSIDSLMSVVMLFKDMSYNKLQRLSLNFSVKNSLARLCTTFIFHILGVLVTQPIAGDHYECRYKPIAKLLATFTNVMRLIPVTVLKHNEEVLRTFEMALYAVTAVPVEDIVIYIGAFKCVYDFLECITSKPELVPFVYTSQHCKHLLKLLLEGSQSMDQSIGLLSYAICENLAKAVSVHSPETEQFRTQHFVELAELLKAYCMLVLKGEVRNLSAIAPALFGLANLQQHTLQELTCSLANSQSPERASYVATCLSELWNGAFRSGTELAQNMQSSSYFVAKLRKFGTQVQRSEA